MKRVIALAALCVVCAGLSGPVTGDAQNALMGTTDKVQRYDLALKAVPSAAGPYTNAADYAAHEWHPGAYRPYRPDGPEGYTWPILAYYPGNRKPLVVWYWGGSFRSSNGGNWGVPERWAYIRYYKEVWDPIAKQGRIPGLDPAIEPPPVAQQPAQPGDGVHIDAVAGQQLVDILKRSFTTQRIQDFMDASPYDEPDTGAPEPSAGER